jgi:hypothetical protein
MFFSSFSYFLCVVYKFLRVVLISFPLIEEEAVSFGLSEYDNGGV